MTVDTPAHSAVRRIPFDALPAFSKLFATYCSDFDALSSFYAADYRSPASRGEAAARAAAHPRDRAAIADVLLEQNARWGLDERTRANIEALRDPASAAVVTGQQVGFLAGPLYTIYKTVTTLQLAERLAEETGRPVVPVFWVEGEDHDFDEIAGVTLLARNETVPLRYDGYTPPAEGNAGAVGRIVLGEQVDAVLAELDAALAPTDFKGAVMSMVREAYVPGATIEDAFTKLMKALFAGTGLVFLNPDDARLKRLTAPLFRREIEDYAAAAEGLRAQSDRLAADYHAQVHARPTNLFLLTPEGRLPIDAEPGDDARFRLRGSERTFTRAELLDVLEAEPERFSPNVVLRPLMQDLLVPTAAYVAGPAEVAYFAQYRPVYAWAGIPMPVIYPRASVSLVEAKVQKVLDKYELSVADAGEDVERLFGRVVLATMEVDVEALFKEAARHLHQAVGTIKPGVEQVDRTLGGAAEALRASMMKELAKLKDRVVRAEKRQQDEVRDQIEKARINLYPGGKLQERVLSPLYFLNKYSPDFIAALRAQLSLDTTAHQVIAL